MVDLTTLKAEDLQGLSPSAVTELATRLLAELKVRAEQGQRDAQAIRFKDAKLEKITFELARLKAWKFGAHASAVDPPAGQCCAAPLPDESTMAVVDALGGSRSDLPGGIWVLCRTPEHHDPASHAIAGSHLVTLTFVRCFAVFRNPQGVINPAKISLRNNKTKLPTTHTESVKATAR
ncbi:hypothetical protein [Pseudomonas mucidolens]|uniref:hypothetical protein n=1 Tax=Pseudomonas mucidolens TaxID=46679 RepID=UPI0030D8AC24